MAHRTLPLAALCLVAACAAPPPDQAIEAAPAGSTVAAATADSSGCPTTGRYAIFREVASTREVPVTTFSITRTRAADDPQGSPEPDSMRGEERWVGDLNGDGKTDRIILLPGTYSSWGDAVVDVYAGCGGDRYVEVWGDETYAFDLELAKTGRTSAHGWRDLALLQRHGAAGDDYMFEELLRFDGRKYAAVPDSVFRVDQSASTRWYPDPPQ